MFESFTTWFSALDGIQQMFWGCALVASAVFLVQMVLTLLGMDGHDVDVDFDAADFGDTDGDTMDTGGAVSLFSVRSMVNFFVGFGWAGVSFHDLIGSPALLIAVSVLVGALFVWVFFFIKKQTKKFEANGAFDIRNCEGRTANVYLRIPEGKAGKGKVQVSVNGSIHEIDALTDGDAIASGQKVRIVEVIDGETLRVVPL
ncbi:MAG: NfeD family protein [Bacteroidales bacterium]|nr:NfeD family protein [Alloprevotella sp.]MBR1644400.1 NfeD family protein [Bacteroidales bacterium]